ncbi:hypothetical protein EZS27_027999, partial [termite gut metagenome]
SQSTEDLLEDSDKGQILYADSAYSGEPIAIILKSKEIENQIHRRASPLRCFSCRGSRDFLPIPLETSQNRLLLTISPTDCLLSENSPK